MRILVTGGYGFIGSFVAERFYKEGYEVSIIDNLSSGDKRNVDFKHKGYQLSVEDRNCEEIFRSNRFDAVVHLAAQVNIDTSMENPRLDTESNVLGLSNMLSLSHKYGVQKFIFASSAAVYGANAQFPLTESAPCDPITPFGINKWVGETYCRKWSEMYGLETLCFRFSNVYGPRQYNVGDSGLVSIFMERVIEGKELSVFGDGGQTRDFIYVEDVADAIFRASYSTLTGVYNLSSNTESKVNDLIDQLNSLNGLTSVSYQDPRTRDIYHSRLDNTRIINDLDWIPKHTFEDGIRKTYEWFLHERSPEEKVRISENDDNPSVVIRIIRFAMPYVENTLVFAATAWLTLTLEDKLYDFIDFKLFYIIVLGIIYGNRQSILAVAFSISLYIYQQLNNGRDLISLVYDTDFFFQVAVYLFVGLVVGYATERKTSLLQSKARKLDALEEKYVFLNEVYNETRLVKEGLQQQIMNSGDSFGKIYTVTKALESLEPEKIFTSTISVVESIMKSQNVTIYTLNKYKSYLRLVARSSRTQFEVAKSIKVEHAPYVQKVLNEKKLFINKELIGDTPLLSAPVLSNGEVVAIISLHDMKFDNFTLYYQNLFNITVDLISSALSRALSYVEATGNQRYIEGTPILIPEVFEAILASKKISNSKHGVEFILLTTDANDTSPEELSHLIARSLRETDYIGMSVNGQLLVLLANSSLEEADFVISRFQQNGISLHVVKEDFSYV